MNWGSSLHKHEKALVDVLFLSVNKAVYGFKITEKEGHAGTCPKMDAWPLAPLSPQTKAAASPLS